MTFPFNDRRMLQCSIEKRSKIFQEKDESEIKDLSYIYTVKSLQKRRKSHKEVFHAHSLNEVK